MAHTDPDGLFEVPIGLPYEGAHLKVFGVVPGGPGVTASP